MFLGTKFWKDCGVLDLVRSTAEGRAYSQHILGSDSVVCIVTCIVFIIIIIEIF